MWPIYSIKLDVLTSYLCDWFPPIVWHKNVNFIDTCRVINSWGGGKLLIVCDLTQQLSQCFSCSGFGVWGLGKRSTMNVCFIQATAHNSFCTITTHSACRPVAFISTASFKRRLTLIALGTWHLAFDIIVHPNKISLSQLVNADIRPRWYLW